MCCFSGPVQQVGSTRIFARMIAPARQAIVYELRLSAASPVAMVLPVPTPPKSPDDAMQFVSLEKYPTLFDDLARCFDPPSRGMAPQGFGPGPISGGIPVHAVGAFEASFVPTLADFVRLDPRFRMPAGTLDRTPGYADWGFAVFQLAATRGPTPIHPMAFVFPTRFDRHLFFPTLHIHDGAIHREADFDHALYAQGLAPASSTNGEYTEATSLYAVKRDKVKDLIDATQSAWRRVIKGRQFNDDQWAQLA
jgi:hypothetical protein